LSDNEYVAKLAKAGFDNIDIEPTRAYSIEDARAFLSGRGLDVDALAREVEDKFISAFVRWSSILSLHRYSRSHSRVGSERVQG
jgi:arsenite methyltransferase